MAEALTSSEGENIVNSGDNSELSTESLIPEQRDNNQMLSPQKAKPFINERNRIKIPIRAESEDNKSEAQPQTVGGRPSNKGWIPIKAQNKPKQKLRRPPKPKPSKQEMYFPTEATPLNGQYLFQNSEQQYYGLPDPYNAIPNGEPQRHLFRPRPFPHSFIPFDSKHGIRHMPYDKYSSYLTETEVSPTLMAMEMTADANKPQHTEPNKEGEAEPVVDTEGKHKDIIEQKEQMIDNKHLIKEKHMIIDNKLSAHGLGGEEIIGKSINSQNSLHF